MIKPKDRENDRINMNRLAALSYQNRAVTDKLRELCIKTVEVKENARLAAPVRSHADMNICPMLNGDVFILKQQRELYDSLVRAGINVLPAFSEPGENYPDDVLLNCLLLGGRLYCNLTAVDKNLKDYCALNGVELAGVRQGYVRCSVCVVDEKSVITADRGLCGAFEENDIDVLRISGGNIRLDGYDTGFIGGCAAKLSDNEILFTGKLSGHPDNLRIRSFIESRNIKIIECDNDELVDIGGIAVFDL